MSHFDQMADSLMRLPRTVYGEFPSSILLFLNRWASAGVRSAGPVVGDNLAKDVEHQEVILNRSCPKIVGLHLPSEASNGLLPAAFDDRRRGKNSSLMKCSALYSARFWLAS